MKEKTLLTGDTLIMMHWDREDGSRLYRCRVLDQEENLLLGFSVSSDHVDLVGAVARELGAHDQALGSPCRLLQAFL